MIRLLQAAALWVAYSAVSNYSLQLLARDGVSLNTLVFLPTFAAGRVGAIVLKTPYGVASITDAAAAYAEFGYATLIQDERGRYGSTGVYAMMHATANDTYDNLDYIVAQPWSIGKVATTG